jgi:hypothetical protein
MMTGRRAVLLQGEKVKLVTFVSFCTVTTAMLRCSSDENKSATILFQTSFFYSTRTKRDFFPQSMSGHKWLYMLLLVD